ncbi:MAG TPA: hypothetical protein VE616_15160 [Candidatus Udaeobacter sp.]|nr:hypothetical protein [Candidatus Udaeobacter sp.]
MVPLYESILPKAAFIKMLRKCISTGRKVAAMIESIRIFLLWLSNHYRDHPNLLDVALRRHRIVDLIAVAPPRSQLGYFASSIPSWIYALHVISVQQAKCHGKGRDGVNTCGRLETGTTLHGQFFYTTVKTSVGSFTVGEGLHDFHIAGWMSELVKPRSV